MKGNKKIVIREFPLLIILVLLSGKGKQIVDDMEKAIRYLRKKILTRVYGIKEWANYYLSK